MNYINMNIKQSNKHVGLRLLGKYDLLTFYEDDEKSIEIEGAINDNVKVSIDPNSGNINIVSLGNNQLNQSEQPDALPSYSRKALPSRSNNLSDMKHVHIPKCNHFSGVKNIHEIDLSMLSVLVRGDNNYLSCNECYEPSAYQISRKLADYINSFKY